MEHPEKLGPAADISNSLLTNGIKWDDYRTSLLGFPVMAFQKKWGIDGKEEYLFIFEKLNFPLTVSKTIPTTLRSKPHTIVELNF